jgi:long-chain acyl-CoA synthetase
MTDGKATEPTTINELFAASVQRNPDAPALTAKYGKEWKPLSYADVQAKLRAFSLGLRSIGVQPLDRVALLSENRPEWAIADLAILAMGAITVPIYPSLPPAQVAHILADSGARALIGSNPQQLEKAISTRSRTPDLQIFVTMESSGAKGDVLSFDALIRKGQTVEATLTPGFEELRDSVKHDDLASIIYTSGTTGDPKGVMLTHGNILTAAQSAYRAMPFKRDETLLSFLPLCHVFERVTYYVSLGSGFNTYYAESIFKVRDNMIEVKPTVMQSVPRLYEAIHEGVLQNIAKQSAARRNLAAWAISIGILTSRRRNWGRFVSPLLVLQHVIADKLVLSKIRAGLGGKWRFFVSGGAPIPTHIAEFFQGIGIPIVEGYGLTETSAGVCANPVGRARIGTVGKALGGINIKVAEDGELLVSGPTVMRGYWNHPDTTAQAIDSDGWFHTGDVGEIDKDGYIRITDRKKDIIVLANGKKVAPQPIENQLRSAELISDIVLIGDRSGTVSALVIPDFDRLDKWARRNGITETSAAALVANAAARKAVKQQIDSLSVHLADFEKIRRIALLDHVFTIDSGELTPTLKVRRKIVAERYGHLLD